MADAVTTQIQLNGRRKYVVHFTNISDGTGESDVVKVAKTGLVDVNGNAITSFAIESVKWSIQGFTSVRLEFDATADSMGVNMGAGVNQCLFFDPPLNDPRAAGFTGDILLTTVGAAANATYDIELTLIKC